MCHALRNHLTLLVIHAKSPRTFGTMVTPHLLLYILDTQQDPDYMMKIRHELAHWVWGSLYGEAPSLFNEGLAVAMERLSAPGNVEADLFRGLCPDNEIPPLPELCRNDTFLRNGTSFYRISGTFVYFLAQRWGWVSVAELFRHTTSEDPSIGDRFAQVFGLSLQEAEVQWRAYLLSTRESLAKNAL